MLGLGNGITGGAALSDFVVSDLSEVITWLKADTGVTETSVGSGVVARWRDNVGEADWVSNTSGRQASVSGTGVNTKLTFDGGDRYYQKEYDWNTTDDAFDFDFPHDVFDVMNAGGSGGLTFFVVMEVDSSLGQTVHSILTEAHFVDDGTPGSGFTARTDISGTIALYTKADFINVGGVNAGAVAFNSGTSAGAEFPLDAKFLATIEYAGGTNGAITLRVNGVNKTLTNNTTLTAGVITIGSLGLNTNGIKGDLYELINCSSKLKPVDRNLVENYLMTRHSIS
tara:strand:- start:18 stop:866 length:849 start_codon:yes stop_codon:yes gene_type:complete